MKKRVTWEQGAPWRAPMGTDQASVPQEGAPDLDAEASERQRVLTEIGELFERNPFLVHDERP